MTHRQDPPRKESKPRGNETDELRKGLEAQGGELDELASRVDSVLRGEDWIQSKLYDLNLSLAVLAHAQSEGDSGSESMPIAARAGKPEYSKCVRRIREIVRRTLPRDAKVIVASKGDDGLLDLYGRGVCHFPQDADGEFPWYYPPDGPAVIAHLETLRARGAEYLLFPQPALWWLETYTQFSNHLHRHYPVVVRDEKTCVIFALEKKYSGLDATAWEVRLSNLIARCTDDTGTDPSILDWNTELQLAERFPDRAVFAPPDDGSVELPYLDGSVDIVVVSSPSGAVPREARRVAGYAVVALGASEPKPGTTAGEDQLHLDVTVEHIREQVRERDMPSCSIIIPTFNGVEQLGPCLASLEETLPEAFSGEIIVVDDGSDEDMQAWLKERETSMPHLRVVRNAQNRGFVVSCNRGARAAKGHILIFLNDDTMPQNGWLQALLRTFADHPEVGAVGGRLLYPDGRLQEAGSVVFSDGSAANFGRDDFAVEAALYSHLREVDYCSAALLATPRSLFSKIGGFDKRFEPGYYEDTDYCFEVRKHGHRVYYQPDSVVVHAEGATGGTDLTSGTKRFQVVNQEKFARKWKQELRNQPDRPERLDFGASYGLAVRGALG